MDESIKKMWYIYTRKYYSTKKKKEILTFVTIYVDFECFMLSELSRTKTKPEWSHLYFESKKAELIKLVEWWLPGAGGWETEEPFFKGRQL